MGAPHANQMIFFFRAAAAAAMAAFLLRKLELDVVALFLSGFFSSSAESTVGVAVYLVPCADKDRVNAKLISEWRSRTLEAPEPTALPPRLERLPRDACDPTCDAACEREALTFDEVAETTLDGPRGVEREPDPDGVRAAPAPDSMLRITHSFLGFFPFSKSGTVSYLSASESLSVSLPLKESSLLLGGSGTCALREAFDERESGRRMAGGDASSASSKESSSSW